MTKVLETAEERQHVASEIYSFNKSISFIYKGYFLFLSLGGISNQSYVMPPSVGHLIFLKFVFFYWIFFGPSFF